MHALMAAAIAFLVAAIAPAGVIPILRRLGAFDIPSGRSLHDSTAVRGVGLAVLLGYLAGCGYLAVVELQPFFLIAAATGLAASLIGLAEDIRGVSVRRRAAAQLVLGLAATAALIVAADASWLLLPLGAIGIAAYINVANFMDGVNAISSLHGIVVGTTLAIAGWGTGRDWLLAVGLVVVASFAAFLPWNLVRRGTFLGDSGSYLLGAAIAVVSIAAFLDGVPLVVILGPVLIYLVDTASTLLRRRARGDDLASSHREHVFQRLAFRRMGHLPSALLVTALSAVAAASGLLALHRDPIATAVAVAAFVVVGVVYLLLPSWIIGARIDPSAAPIQVRPTDRHRRFSPKRWAVVGATGFVGSAVVSELRSRNIDVLPLSAPRLEFDPAGSLADADRAVAGSGAFAEFARSIEGVDVLVNAAGVADSRARSGRRLFGANALLPVWLARAADRAGVARMVQISSAAVQGRAPLLDESPATAAFSPYSRSKAVGEELILSSHLSTTEVVILRATSVQGPARPATLQLQRLARSWLSSVASPGDRPTVVSSIGALADFVASVGGHRRSVPAIVLQPWEGMTTAEVLTAAGSRRPRMIPEPVCRAVIGAGFAACLIAPGLAGTVRRVELMWLGQAQDASWARSAGVDVVPQLRQVLVGQAAEAS